MQEILCVAGGRKLSGKVRVSGAKNASLPLLFACLLTKEEVILENVPDLEDTGVTMRLLRSLGAEAEFEKNTVRVRAQHIRKSEAPYNLVKALRASFWVLGPLLARTGKAEVSLPGGDAIGTRPVDIHLKGLREFGAEFQMKHGVVHGSIPGKLKPAHVKIEFPSVGATHTLLMTAASIPGTSVIEGAACEPEVVEVATLLTKLGARIEGAGTSTITVHGVSEFGAATHKIMGDRIEAATYLLSGAMTGGTVTVEGIEPSALSATLDVLTHAGAVISCGDDYVSIAGPKRLRATSFETNPFPGVATDVQPLLLAAMTIAEGESRIKENIFESRFGHVAEYRRFGADITVDGRFAIVRGVEQLSGAPVDALDIRAAAGMVLLGLVSEGVTQIRDIYHLDRGYSQMVDKLRKLGATISRVPAVDEREVVLGC